jgi:hypothetical protein
MVIVVANSKAKQKEKKEKKNVSNYPAHRGNEPKTGNPQ